MKQNHKIPKPAILWKVQSFLAPTPSSWGNFKAPPAFFFLSRSRRSWIFHGNSIKLFFPQLLLTAFLLRMRRWAASSEDLFAQNDIFGSSRRRLCSFLKLKVYSSARSSMSSSISLPVLSGSVRGTAEQHNERTEFILHKSLAFNMRSHSKYHKSLLVFLLLCVWNSLSFASIHFAASFFTY